MIIIKHFDLMLSDSFTNVTPSRTNSDSTSDETTCFATVI